MSKWTNYFSARDVGKRFGISTQKVNKYVEQGVLKANNTIKPLIFTLESVNEFAKQTGQESFSDEALGLFEEEKRFEKLMKVASKKGKY